MPAKFVLKKGTTGKFRFNLLSTNGQVVATSQPYDSKAAARNGIKAVQRLAAAAPVEDQTTRAWEKAEEERKAPKKAAQPAQAAAKAVPRAMATEPVAAGKRPAKAKKAAARKRAPAKKVGEKLMPEPHHSASVAP
jgi:uncharacterized protein YegP (UPF0339 family)